MRYKKIIYSLVYVVIFFLLWIFLNRNYISILDKLDEHGLVTLTSAYSGYNCIISHGSLYVILFMILLTVEIPKDTIQYLIRIKRKGYLHMMYKKTAVVVLQFAIIFASVLVFLTMYYEKDVVLFSTTFWIGTIIFAVTLYLYYYFVGAVFNFFNLMLFSNQKSFIFTFVLMVVLMRVGRRVWTPVTTLDVFDDLYSSNLNVLNVVLDIIILIVLSLGTHFLTYIIFKDKDVLNEKS